MLIELALNKYEPSITQIAYLESGGQIQGGAKWIHQYLNVTVINDKGWRVQLRPQQRSNLHWLDVVT